MSHAFTEQGLLLAFKLQRELIQSEDRYEAAHSFVTCMDVCVSYPGKCKVQISSASPHSFTNTFGKGCSFSDFFSK